MTATQTRRGGEAERNRDEGGEGEGGGGEGHPGGGGGGEPASTDPFTGSLVLHVSLKETEDCTLVVQAAVMP